MEREYKWQRKKQKENLFRNRSLRTRKSIKKIKEYPDNILILDAKNINTSPEIPIYLDNNVLMSAGAKEIIKFHPATYIWKNIFIKNNIKYSTLTGCVVIVNKRGACIWKNKEWYTSDVKPIHISDLVNFLHSWIEDKNPEINLSLLVTLSKMQIKKEKSSLNIKNKMKRFGI